MERLKEILLYQDDSPLLFTAFYFWGFFAILLLVYSFIYKKKALRNAYLFFMSLFFYYKSGGYFFSLLIFSTLVDYTLGQLIYAAKTNFKKKIFVACSVIVNLGVLAYFKYTYFFVNITNEIFNSDFEVVNILSVWSNSIAGTKFDVSSIILPVGISFYTFQTISYSIDLYRGKLEKPVNSIIDFGFYVSFFPQLVAGPIVRAAEFIPQLYKEFQLKKEEFGIAFFLIMNGLVKKMLISDYISINFVDRIFDAPASYSGFENLMAVYGYAIQIYCDFSGYTDIAIGVALLLGFKLPLNFNSPYKALNITDFWRRWHISLSSWLRDYLYIPLGGNRNSSFGTYFFVILFLLFGVSVSVNYGYIWLAVIIAAVFVLLIVLRILKINVHNYLNLAVTMLLGGLWHGAAVRFVIWGALHGVGLAVHKIWMNFFPPNKKEKLWVRFISIFVTFQFVNFAWIFFRAKDMRAVNEMLHQIAFSFQWSLIPEMIVSYKNIFLIMVAGFIIHWLPLNIKDWYSKKIALIPNYAKVALTVVVIFLLYQAKSSDIQPFIYFQF